MGKPETKKRPKTAEEIRQQKRECERRRRARIKANAALYELAKEKDRTRKKNKVKLVADMTAREHRKQQKEWRERKLRSRLKQKRTKALLKHLGENSPETTDDEETLPIRPESPSILGSVVKVTRPQSSCASDSSVCSNLIRSTSNSPRSLQSEPESRQKKKGVQALRVRRELSNLIIRKQKETIDAMKKKIHALQVKLTRRTKQKKDMGIVTRKRPLKINTETPNITNVTISVVTESDIEALDRVLIDQGKSITGTLQIHQVTWVVANPVRIYLRKLTCLSSDPGSVCLHYSLSKGFTDFISIPSVPAITQEVLSSRDENIISQHSINENDLIFKDKHEENVPDAEEGENVRPTSKLKDIELKDGIWVIVRFLFRRKEKHYIGQVIGFDGDEPRIKFTKKKQITKEHAVFVWIDPEDVFAVPRADMMSILKEPTPGRRGELFFDIDELKCYRNMIKVL